MLVRLNKDQYDSFIDYLKGVSILFVVLAHCLPLQNYILFSLWGAQAVPLFLLIQVFHAYKRGKIDISQYYNLKKLFQRIILPFLLLVFIQVALLIIFSDADLLFILKGVIYSGGIGPGSYYVWIYLQFFILLPAFQYLINRLNEKFLLTCFIGLSVLSEIICSCVNMPSWLYRLLFVRYLFLIYLGYQWVTNGGIPISKKTIILSLVSILFILVFQYTDVNLEPFFYFSDWKIFHWICYFYVAYIFVYILSVCYKMLPFVKWWGVIGKYSYEIFLVQMFVFTFYPTDKIQMIIDNVYVTVIVRIFVTTLLSIIPVLLYKKYFSHNKYHV